MRHEFRRGDRIRFSSLVRPWTDLTGTVRAPSKPEDRRVYVEWDHRPGDPSWESRLALSHEEDYQRDKGKPLGEWARYRAGVMG